MHGFTAKTNLIQLICFQNSFIKIIVWIWYNASIQLFHKILKMINKRNISHIPLVSELLIYPSL